MADSRLAGKTALVTGAGNGIGRAIAEALADEEAAVLCADIAEDDAREVAEGIIAAGGKAVPWHCDVSDPTHAAAAVEATVATFGALHVLVNNAAGFVPLTPVEETPVENWDSVLAVILSGAFHMSKPAIPRIRDAGGGSIIHVASQMGRVAWPGQAAYCAAKGALFAVGQGDGPGMRRRRHPGQHPVARGRRHGPAGQALRRSGNGGTGMGPEAPSRPPWPTGRDGPRRGLPRQ